MKDVDMLSETYSEDVRKPFFQNDFPIFASLLFPDVNESTGRVCGYFSNNFREILEK